MIRGMIHTNSSKKVTALLCSDEDILFFGGNST